MRVEALHKSFPIRRPWLETILFPLRAQYVQVLTDVTLEVGRGECFGLLGPNGAGKTTLLKILSALILPDQGSVTVCGYDVARRPNEARSRLRPVVADERSLLWRLSARENLRLYASLQGLRRRSRDDRVAEVLELVELAGEGDKMVAKFSSGMKQRLLIARALLGSPDVLLLDEPTRSLDPVSARRFRAFLRDEIVGRHGRTVLIATHNPEDALELCDRIGVLHRGRLLRTGSPHRLAHELQDRRYSFSLDAAGWEAFLAGGGRLQNSQLAAPAVLEAGWVSVVVDLPGGNAQVAEVVRRLVAAGVAVGPVEPVRLSLAEMIERIIGGEGVVSLNG